MLVTIGIFTITRLERDVQIMIPSYDFCVPRKECPSAPDDPCEVFSKIDFPTGTQYTVATVTLLIHLLLNAVVKTDYTEKRG